MIVDFGQDKYLYEDLISDADALAKRYNNIISNVTIGESHDNRDIVMLRLGIGRKYILFCGGVHGREIINPIVLMKITEFYANQYEMYKSAKERFDYKLRSSFANYQKQYDNMIFSRCVYELLQTYTILIIPLLNPDGYMISLYGLKSIRRPDLQKKLKRIKHNYFEWKFNGRGVDINRNFPCRSWKPKGVCDYAASENETKALIQVFHQYRIICLLDFHSRGKSIYYYRNNMTKEYNDKQLFIAKRLKSITKYDLYSPDNEIDNGDSGGNTVHYFSEHFNKPALTIETVDEDANFPLDYIYRTSTYEEIKLILFELGGLLT
jgi:g-D-glutamyl-meso-diaminopimelate peptidase